MHVAISLSFFFAYCFSMPAKKALSVRWMYMVMCINMYKFVFVLCVRTTEWLDSGLAFVFQFMSCGNLSHREHKFDF